MPQLVLSKEYPALRKKVEETLLLGQRKIEQAKVQIYWQTGKLIQQHLARYKTRSDRYGEQVIAQLSEDLDVSRDVLWRCLKFAESFKIVVAPPQSSLSWTHFTKLITVHDEQTRLSLLRRAEKSHWTSDELARKIDQEVKEHRSIGNGKSARSVQPSSPKLIPRKGEVYTYVFYQLIDLGFKIHQQLPQNAPGNLKPGQIIETIKNKDGDYEVRRSTHREADLFTYKANVVRVVDGDTLYVDIDLGFKTGVFQYLRLRGIDAPELGTPEGKKAKAFVERELARVPYIILTSSRSDKYDRYLADVWYGGETGDENYLNQRLLDEGLAERWG